MSQIWDIYCKHCLWSIFGPCWCTKSCKTTYYAHLSQIWKLTRFTRFVQKVFATKILLSGKFSLFVTLFKHCTCRVRCLCHTWEVFPSSIGKTDVCHRSPAYCRCTGLQIPCQLLPPTSRRLCDICHGACYCNGRENLWKKALWIFQMC